MGAELTDEELLMDYADTPFVKALLEKLSREDAAYVVRLLQVKDYCGSCFGVGPWCCYDPMS